MSKIFSTKLLNKMSEKGLEPSKISPYAPETYVSTSSTTPTNRSIIQFSLRLSGSNVVEVLRTLSENVTLSHLFFGRVPLRQISPLFNFHYDCRVTMWWKCFTPSQKT